MEHALLKLERLEHVLLEHVLLEHVLLELVLLKMYFWNMWECHMIINYISKQIKSNTGDNRR